MLSAASPAASRASSAVLPGSPQAASPSRAAAENSVPIRSCLSHVHGPGKGTARSFPAGTMGGQPVGEDVGPQQGLEGPRSEEHTSELQSLMRISYAVFCLKKKKNINRRPTTE